MEEMIEENSDLNRYPDPIAREFRETAETHLQMTTAVAHHYNEGGRRLFDITSKHPMLWHAADSAKWCNPRRTWCFMGEDFMQHMRSVAAATLRGTPGHMISRKLADLWPRGFTFRFLPRGEWFSREVGARQGPARGSAARCSG